MPCLLTAKVVALAIRGVIDPLMNPMMAMQQVMGELELPALGSRLVPCRSWTRDVTTFTCLCFMLDLALCLLPCVQLQAVVVVPRGGHS